MLPVYQAHVVERTLFYISAVALCFLIFGGLLGGFGFSEHAFIMSRYDVFHIIDATIADFDRVSVKDFMKR